MSTGGNAEQPWILQYWAAAGRGEFVRLVFEEAGITYVEDNDSQEILRLLRTRETDEERDFLHFAPPIIKKGDFSLSQTPVICKYLGQQFGLSPRQADDQARAEQINTTIHDYIAEGRLAFHGLHHTMTYHKQKEETKPYIETFIKERLPKFLGHFEKVLGANGDGRGFVIGDSITYVDLALLHVLRATEFQFADVWKSLIEKRYPLLVAFKNRMEKRPRLVEYLKSDRCQPFAGDSMM